MQKISVLALKKKQKQKEKLTGLTFGNIKVLLFSQKKYEQMQVFREVRGKGSRSLTSGTPATSPMALLFALLVSLVVIRYRSTCSVSCGLPQTHRLGHRRALIILGQMRRISILSFLKERIPLESLRRNPLGFP
jgi:hypothetical protein